MSMWERVCQCRGVLCHCVIVKSGRMICSGCVTVGMCLLCRDGLCHCQVRQEDMWQWGCFGQCSHRPEQGIL